MRRCFDIFANPLVISSGFLLSLSACFERGPASHEEASRVLPYKQVITPSGENLAFNPLEDEQSTPEDPRYLLTKPVFDALQAPYAWAINNNCSALKIAVIDTGIDIDHEDFELSHNQNHFRDIIKKTNGIDAVDDTHGHGTHVAGIIGAKGNNGEGISGVCWESDLVIAKALDAGGSAATSDIVDAMEWALSVDGVRILNASLGITIESTTSRENQYFEDMFSGVLQAAQTKDALIVAAAGNNGKDVDVHRVYPAALNSSQIISVASNLEGQAIDHKPREGIWGGSNYGGRTIHLSAPGIQIYSTLLPSNINNYSHYGFKTGTSMATPLVSGALALAWNHIGPNKIRSHEIMSLLLNNVEKHLATQSGTPGVYLLTGGKLDLGFLMKAADNFKENP